MKIHQQVYEMLKWNERKSHQQAIRPSKAAPTTTATICIYINHSAVAGCSHLLCNNNNNNLTHFSNFFAYEGSCINFSTIW